jgi:Zn-dependent peptidase ImmA (M78 family)
VTKSRSWEQRASRAFAAELLAPKEELRKRFRSETDLEEIEEAANEYEISSRVIEFQLETHRLSIIAQL